MKNREELGLRRCGILEISRRLMHRLAARGLPPGASAVLAFCLFARGNSVVEVFGGKCIAEKLIGISSGWSEYEGWIRRCIRVRTFNVILFELSIDTLEIDDLIKKEYDQMENQFRR